MDRHTPGPWNLTLCGWDGADDAAALAVSGRGWHEFAKVVVCLDGIKANSPEGLANAALIGAAPDLLEIAKEFATCGMRTANDPRFARLDAVIAKALGQ